MCPKQCNMEWRQFEVQSILLHKGLFDDQEAWHWIQVGDKMLGDVGFIHTYNQARMYRGDAKAEGRVYSIQEYGLDGIAFDGTTYHGIQAKYWNDHQALTAKSLGTFISVVFQRMRVKDPNSLGYLYTTCPRIERNLRDDCANSGAIVIHHCKPHEVVALVEQEAVMEPREYQLRAMDELKKGWEGMGALVMPCGTGKTLVYATHALEYSRVVVLSPLRVSAKQNLDQLIKVFCPDQALLVDSDRDKDDCGFKATRDIETVRGAWNGDRTLISATYHSACDVLKAAGVFKEGGALVIVDEAHNLVSWPALRGVLSNSGMKCLLATATPPAAMTEDWTVPTLFQYGFPEAFQNSHITDYEILLPWIEDAVSDRNLADIQSQFLVDGMLLHGTRRVIVYCSSKKDCDDFLTYARHAALEFHGLCEGEVWTARITDDVSSTRRAELLEEFQRHDGRIQILAAVRILDEAIDIPLCDGVFIRRPSHKEEGATRLIQRVSRAMRLVPDQPNKKARIFMWLDVARDEDAPKCLRLLKEIDPEFYLTRVHVQRTDTYTTSDFAVKVDEEVVRYAVETRERIRTKAMTIREIVDMRVGMLLRYFQHHGKWPQQYSNDPATGLKMGSFLNRVRHGITSLTETQRGRLLEVDAGVFDIKAKSHAARTMTMDEKVDILIVYFRHHGKWPQQTYKDPTGLGLGKFLQSVKQGSTSLSETQRGRLLDMDAGVFDVKAKSHAARTMTKDEKVDLLIGTSGNTTSGLPELQRTTHRMETGEIPGRRETTPNQPHGDPAWPFNGSICRRRAVGFSEGQLPPDATTREQIIAIQG